MTAEPFFKSIFGTDWEKLPPVFRKHYANRARTPDIAVCEGVMSVKSSLIGRLLAPLFRLSGTLVPYEGTNIPATVRFMTAPDRDGFFFDRTFYFPDKKPYRFLSTMIPVGGNALIEYTRLGFGWHLAYGWNGQAVTLSHLGYRFKFFGYSLPFPGTMLIGHASATETALDDNRFAMDFTIRHPLWGFVFGYSGVFRMMDTPA